MSQTTTPTEDQFEQHLANQEIDTIRHLIDMYPANTWSWEESLMVKSAMAEIALWRQRGHRGEQLERAAADIAHRNQMRAITIAEIKASRRAAAAPCDLCDEDGLVLGRDGKPILDSNGYELHCRHGQPVELDDQGVDR
jgi:hypothetical protein